MDFVLDIILYEHTQFSLVINTVVIEYVPELLNHKINYKTYERYLLPILNHIFVIQNVCNAIICDYLKIKITFAKKINSGAIRDMIISNDNVYIHKNNNFFCVNVITNKTSLHVTNCDIRSGMLVKSNNDHAMAILSGKLVDLTTMKEINIKQNNTWDNKTTFDQYYYNNDCIYIRDVLEMKRRSLKDNVETVITVSNVSHTEPVLDFTNDDVYLYNNHHIIKMNFRNNITEQIELGYYHSHLFIYNDELYIINSIDKLIIIFDKSTLCVLYTINIKKQYSNCMHIVVNDKYIVLSSNKHLYVYKKIDD